MSSMAPPYVREMARKGRIHYSDHALLVRMSERKIWIDQILAAILNGEVLDVQNFGLGKDVTVIFQEATDKTPRFYVVVATSYPEVEVITVAEFKEEAWEWLGKIMARRRKE